MTRNSIPRVSVKYWKVPMVCLAAPDWMEYVNRLRALEADRPDRLIHKNENTA